MDMAAKEVPNMERMLTWILPIVSEESLNKGLNSPIFLEAASSAGAKTPWGPGRYYQLLVAFLTE